MSKALQATVDQVPGANQNMKQFASIEKIDKGESTLGLWEDK